jgi:hypothetical protein
MLLVAESSAVTEQLSSADQDIVEPEAIVGFDCKELPVSARPMFQTWCTTRLALDRFCVVTGNAAATACWLRNYCSTEAILYTKNCRGLIFQLGLLQLQQLLSKCSFNIRCEDVDQSSTN